MEIMNAQGFTFSATRFAAEIRVVSKVKKAIILSGIPKKFLHSVCAILVYEYNFWKNFHFAKLLFLDSHCFQNFNCFLIKKPLQWPWSRGGLEKRNERCMGNGA